MTTLAQTWSVFSFSNLIPTSYTSDVTLDKARLIYGIIMNVGTLFPIRSPSLLNMIRPDLDSRP